ncbi:hypothetical protein [Acidipropionibacterium acidipropionici]|nr:hypothetical protein [Acidipropionibacterium acidipropionici]
MTASDLARLSREASEVLGWECLLWACNEGEENLLPGERVTYL